MKPLKIMTIVGTRPELIRLSAVIPACDIAFDHIFVHTGQNWDDCLGNIFVRELGLRDPDHQLACAQPYKGKTPHLGEVIGVIIAQSYGLMLQHCPDALLLLGDTNSALSAISAKRLGIPIFHMEAGNRCFDEAVPEEVNRKIVDHLADINLPYTEHSRRYLLSEGIPAGRIFVTGSPMREVLSQYRASIAESDVLDVLGLVSGQYFLVSAHREENIDHPDHLCSLMEALGQVVEQYGLPVIYSVHPRSQNRLLEQKITFPPLVKCYAPFGFFDYNRLQQHAFCVLSDSGTLSEEAGILKFPAVLLRTSTERPELLDAGGMIIGGITASSILPAIELATQSSHRTALLPDYQDDNVSDKVVRLIQSYTPLLR